MCSVLIISHYDLPATPRASHFRSQFASNTSTRSSVWVSALNQWAVFPCDARWNNSNWIHPQFLLKSITKHFFSKGIWLPVKCRHLEKENWTVQWLLEGCNHQYLALKHLWRRVLCSKHSPCLDQELPAITDAASPWLPAGVFKGQTSIRFSVLEGPRCGHLYPDRTHSNWFTCAE